MRKSSHSEFLLGLLSVGVLVAAALTVSPAQAASANGPYYPTPSWDQKLPAEVRFVVLLNWNSEAVLDRETGLVWEQSPTGIVTSWGSAVRFCFESSFGGRRGWRLPAITELASLLATDTFTIPGIARLPPGHPFTRVEAALYWSATSKVGDPPSAWFVNFDPGFVDNIDKAGAGRVWCVRGGMNADVY